MSKLKELGVNGNLVQIDESDRDYLKPYIHQQEIRITSPSESARKEVKRLQQIKAKSLNVKITPKTTYKKTNARIRNR